MKKIVRQKVDVWAYLGLKFEKKRPRKAKLGSIESSRAQKRRENIAGCGVYKVPIVGVYKVLHSKKRSTRFSSRKVCL